MQTQIDYQIKSSGRARHIRISVYPDGRVVITKPDRVPESTALQFAHTKSVWIMRTVNKNRNRKTIPLENTGSRSDALDFVKSRLEFYNQHYKFDYARVSIKNHKRLWGSCSVRRNLNFNHRLTQLTQDQSDYIIVHELCHLKEMNHSAKFWALVAETIPDYKNIRKELKDYSFY